MKFAFFVFLFTCRALANNCSPKNMCDEMLKLSENRTKTVRFSTGIVPAKSELKNLTGCADKVCTYKPGDQARAERLTTEMIGRLREVVLAGRDIAKTNLFTIAELNLLSRIRRMKLGDLSTGPCKRYCEDGDQWAHQDDEGGMCICPIIMNYPDEAVLFTLAHEAAHAIDNCSLFDEVRDGPNTILAMDYDQHPFKTGRSSIYTCLSKLGISTGNQSGKPISQQARRLTRTVFDEEFPKLYAPIRSAGAAIFGIGVQMAFPSNPDCQGPMSGSELQEAVADWAGAEVLGSYLKDHPETLNEPNGHLKPFSMFLQFGCKEKSRSKDGLIDQHPKIETRMSVTFSSKNIRQALNCEVSQPPCEYQPRPQTAAEEWRRKGGPYSGRGRYAVPGTK